MGSLNLKIGLTKVVHINDSLSWKVKVGNDIPMNIYYIYIDRNPQIGSTSLCLKKKFVAVRCAEKALS